MTVAACKKKVQQAKTAPVIWPYKAILMTLLLTLGIVAATFGLRDYLSDPERLPLQVIQVKGEMQHLDRDHLKATVAKAIDGGFFTVNIQKIHQDVSRLSWVDEISIRRVWPDTLVMEVTEQVPVARWGNQALVNKHGEIFHPQQPLPDGLVRLYGPEASAGRVVNLYQKFTERLMDHGLVIQRMGLDAQRNLRIDFSDGMQIALGHSEVQQRLARFLAAYPLLKDSEKRLLAVDMRYEQGFSVRWEPMAASTEPQENA
jgi:cell division protein FtsQ